MKIFLFVVIALAVVISLLIVINVLKTQEQKNGSENGSEKSKWRKRVEENFFTFLLIIAGVVVLSFGLYSTKLDTPSLASTVTWCWNHWLWILIFAGILSALVAINGDFFGKAAGVLQTSIVVVVLMLVIGFPVINRFVSPGAGSSAKQADIPLVSELSVAERPKLTMPPVVGGKSERVQYTPEMAGHHIKVDGNNFLLHTVYQDGTECAFGEQCDTTKPQAGAYVTNKVRETNVVSYAFVQD